MPAHQVAPPPETAASESRPMQSGAFPSPDSSGFSVSGSSSRSGAQQHGLRRLQQDHSVEEQRALEDVVELVLELSPRVLDARAVRIVHLRPPRHARPDGEAQSVVRNLALELLHEMAALGP